MLLARGRILSAEEVSYSVRLRSMYAHGDENATDWSTPAVAVTMPPESPERANVHTQPEAASSSDEVASLKVSKQRTLEPEPSRGRSSRVRDSSILRTASEVAGGMEDYSEVSGRHVDRYGFIRPSPIAEQEDAGRTAGAIKRREWSREEKWRKMAVLRSSGRGRRGTGDRTTITGGGMAFSFDTNDSLVVSRTWKGVPDRWRATAWHGFLSASAKKRGGESDDILLDQFHQLQEQNCADDVQIDVDVPRSINMHVMFRKRYRGGQRLLFRVLHAIALKFPDIGYVQGMASLATTLLCYFEEAMAFVMMVRLWELRGLKELFCHGFDGLMAALAEFDKEWLGQGEVAQKLEELGISGTAYGTRWYLTLFNMSIPFPAQLRIWDVFMLLGDKDDVGSDGPGSFGGASMDVLHAASAALIDATRDILLDSDFENAMKTLTSWIPVKDEDLLMRVAKAEWTAKKRRMKKAH
ncbi:hypothetical protein ANO11243_000270 [Dothideomycetidae sp. 11243]|nr:hypothetical protein ANO11243_000270 [fungal sp. No.11243]